MKKFLLSLMLVTPLVCQYIEKEYHLVYRCENDEVVCYLAGRSLHCKFK